jgi:hypothetical protein
MTEPIIIIGMHRSGTTLVAKILDDLGVFMGKKLDHNHESFFFLDLNNWMLRSANASWDNPYNFQFVNETVSRELQRVLNLHINSPILAQKYFGFFRSLKTGTINNIRYHWGWKDPRTTFTYDIWKYIFPEAKILHVYRNPIDVAQSLRMRETQQRNKLMMSKRTSIKNRIKEYTLSGTLNYQLSIRLENIDEGIILWKEYVRKALSLESNKDSKIFHIKYERLVELPEVIIDNMMNFIGIKKEDSRLIKILPTINEARKYAFIKNDALVKKYKEIQNNDLIKKLTYDKII